MNEATEFQSCANRLANAGQSGRLLAQEVLYLYVGYPAMIWPRILVFTSMMLRVLTPAAFGSYGAGIYIPKLGLVPKHVRPVRPVANLYDLLTS